MSLQQILQKYRPNSFHDKLNQRLVGAPFDAYGMPRNTRYSHLGLMDVAFVGNVSISPFSPLDIANLKLWLDADDLSTITKDGGDLVSQWDDKSGEGNDVSQATGSDQPLWVDSVQNGKPIIRFDGVNDFLNRSTFVGGGLTQPNHIFVVCKIPDTSTGSNGYVFDGATARHLLVHLNIATDSDYRIYAGTDLDAATTVDTTNILLYTVLFNTTLSTLRKSKSQILSGDAGSLDFNGIVLGASVGLDQLSNLDIAEILVYNASLGTTDRDDVETYLTNKWAV